MNPYIPAIITASMALIVGVGAQFLNNWLTRNREEKKYKKDCYQNLFGPLGMRLYRWITSGDSEYYRQSWKKITEEDYLNSWMDREWRDILKFFDDNIKYASPDLMQSYFQINTSFRYDDERINFSLRFFKELDSIMRSLKIKPPKFMEIKELISILESWNILDVQFDPNIANLSLIYEVLPDDFAKRTKIYYKKTDPGGPRTVHDDFLRYYPYFKENFFDKLVKIEDYEKEYIKHYDNLYKKIQEEQKA
ncbi:hypothetical protein [Neobacillus mesonae]|uniref:Uncharacterized protein n=1 Tax=Neobacillus mesonae TaxID=1193713 RepID=A0A3T0HSL5_9BACI|nr:hypothetical protein [Neobacillus mesonae]AZU60109.1 hypothetical protein CHR53_01850 [Neobacillus mesonae]